MNFLSEWMQGQKDCQDGISHTDGRGDSYDLGYSEEYEKQQIQDAKLCQLS